jgi:putative acetyltransferase
MSSGTSLVIRAERPSDWSAIHDVVYAAFLGHPHAPPGSEPVEQQIVEALRDDGALTLSLVAEAEGNANGAGEIVGHIAFSPVVIETRSLGWVGLGPVAVRPDLQRQGIGAALIREGLRRLIDMRAAGVVLLGAPAYYERFGFRPDDRLRLTGFPAEYFLCLPLEGHVPTGEVTYHPSFSAAQLRGTPRVPL